MLTTTNVATPPATTNIVVEERVDAITHGNMSTWNDECVLLLRNICITRFKRTHLPRLQHGQPTETRNGQRE